MMGLDDINTVGQGYLAILVQFTYSSQTNLDNL